MKQHEIGDTVDYWFPLSRMGFVEHHRFTLVPFESVARADRGPTDREHYGLPLWREERQQADGTWEHHGYGYQDWLASCVDFRVYLGTRAEAVAIVREDIEHEILRHQKDLNRLEAQLYALMQAPA